VILLEGNSIKAIMGTKAHFIFALIFFFIGRTTGDNIFYFISTYSLVIGVSAFVYRLSVSQKESALESSKEIKE
jgi:uncharacterized membrane protein